MKNYLLLILLFACSLFTACSDEENKDEIIPTSDFALGAPFRWNLSGDKDVLLVIQSDVDMYKYVKKDDLTEILPNTPDFGKSTLFLAKVFTTSGISSIETRLIKHNNTNYTFEVDISTNEATIAENRVVAATCPLLPANAKVTSKIMIKQPR